MRVRRRSFVWWGFSVLLATAPGTDARADVVGPPPQECPPGSSGDSCHGGPFCSPSVCDGDEDCAPGDTCQAVKACVGEIHCGGLEGGDDPPVPTFEGPCKTDGTCGGEATCQPLMQCVAPLDPTTGGSTTAGTGGSGGATGGNTSSTGGTAGTAGSTGGASAGSTGGDTGGGGKKGGCTGCGAGDGAGGAALALLAIAGLVRRRRGRAPG